MTHRHGLIRELKQRIDARAEPTRALRGGGATAHPAPDPFDRELEELLRDPAVIARLDDLHDRFDRGELELHDHEAARAIVERAERRDAGQEGDTPA
jgi:hypothetical protein